MVLQSLNATSGFDPMTNAGGMNPTFNLYQGALPYPSTMQQGTTTNAPMTVLPPNFKWKIPSIGAPTATGGQRLTEFIWVCLRRPANPFAPVSALNPMLVVDAMRVPYIDGTGSNVTTDTAGNPAVNTTFNTIYSAQRFQPYRGGHAVPPSQTLQRLYELLAGATGRCARRATATASRSCRRPRTQRCSGRRGSITPTRAAPRTLRPTRSCTRWGWRTSTKWALEAVRARRWTRGRCFRFTIAISRAWRS